jgi:hypothetical protein
MKSKNLTKTLMIVSAATLGLAAIGCDSSSNCTDAGVCPDGGAKGGSSGLGGSAGGLGGAGGAPMLYALTPGTYCFEVVSIAPGYVDSCDDGVELVVSTPAAPSALPVTYYDAATTTTTGIAIPAGTVEVGNDGSLGRGVIDKNKATLLRDNTTSLPVPDQTCMWHQKDTTAFELTATNTFNVSVTETQDSFAAACAGTSKTVHTPCTSTWTWTMKILSPQSLTPPSCEAL